MLDENKTRLTLVSSNPGKGHNWLFLAGGPGADSEYFSELLEVLDLPGNVWLVDLPENGSNSFGKAADFSYSSWEFALKHVLKSLDHVKFEIPRINGALFYIGSEEPGLMLKKVKNPKPSCFWVEVESAEDARRVFSSGAMLETVTGFTLELQDPCDNSIGFADYSKKPELAR